MLRIIADTQLKDNENMLTHKELYNILLEAMVVSSPDIFDEYLKEPMEHHLIIEKKVGDKRLLKLNLQEDVLIKLKSGEFEGQEI